MEHSSGTNWGTRFLKIVLGRKLQVPAVPVVSVGRSFWFGYP